MDQDWAGRIAENIERVQVRIRGACDRAGRDPGSVTLIGVTKTFPVEAVEAARRAGLADFGENKVQELVSKAGVVRGRVEGGGVCWHMIGHLQRNKAKEVVRCADLFHGLDSLRLAEELDRRAEQAGRVMPCLVQVNVSGERTKSGVAPGDALALLRQAAALPHVRLRGLMAIAEPAEDPEAVRPQFRLLRNMFEAYRAESGAEWDSLSMGMSDDFEVAIEEGATLVRIGSAIFGSRG
ncbi:MAG TPA: YggS family pyridoxal phosphate-dependent enzyme [Rhodothermales bacterium]|nr:YggS family pyridoxal phosphate-dependent enzyme [Rhodothermales bacterium]